MTRLTCFQAIVRPHGQKRERDLRPDPCVALNTKSTNRRGTGTARNTPRFRCLSVSNTMASLLASMLSARRANTSDILAPVKASVRQNAPTVPPSATAAETNESLSRATRYLRLPVWSNSDCVIGKHLVRLAKKSEQRPLTRGRTSEQNTAFCSPIALPTRFVEMRTIVCNRPMLRRSELAHGAMIGAAFRDAGP